MSASRLSTIDYPTSDGKPMAETDLHRDLMIDGIKTLDHHYRNASDVYVSGNLLIYYEEGNKRKHVSPDVFVVFGVPKRKRDYFLLWEERQAPRVLIELTSKSTKKEDVKTKKEVYRDRFKAHEYFLFDPTGDYLDPRLRGFRLVDGDWQDVLLHDGKMFSEVLGLELHIDGDRLRFFDPVAGQYLATPEERAETAEERAETAEECAKNAEQRAKPAEAAERRAAAENESLRRELEDFKRRQGGA